MSRLCFQTQAHGRAVTYVERAAKIYNQQRITVPAAAGAQHELAYSPNRGCIRSLVLRWVTKLELTRQVRATSGLLVRSSALSLQCVNEIHQFGRDLLFNTCSLVCCLRGEGGRSEAWSENAASVS